MLNIVWDFQTQFYKIAVGSQYHKLNNTDLPQLIEQVLQSSGGLASVSRNPDISSRKHKIP